MQGASASLDDFLTVPGGELLYGSRFAGVDHGPSATSFPVPGLPARGLCPEQLGGVRRSRSGANQRDPTVLAILVVTLYSPSAVPVPVRSHPADALPYGFLYQVCQACPRCGTGPARIEADLALAVLAGFGAVALSSSSVGSNGTGATRRSGRDRSGVMLESWNQPIPMVPIETGSSLPPVYAWLHDQAPGVVVAEIPDGMVQDYRYEYFSTYDWHPRLNGTSGFRPPAYDQVRNSWRTSRIRRGGQPEEPRGAICRRAHGYTDERRSAGGACRR